MKTSERLTVIAWVVLAGMSESGGGAAAQQSSPASQGVRQLRDFHLPNRPGHVDLLLDVPEGATAPAGYPVTTGVPFADGWLKETSALCVQTADGKAVPAQFEVRGKYPRTGNVRWLGVDFQLAAGAKGYRLVFDKASPAHPQPVAIRKEGAGYVVTTGGLKAELSPAGCGLKRVSRDAQVVVEQGADDGNWFTTLDGQRYADGRDNDVKMAIEREGPLTTTVRVDGRYRSANGEPSCRWTIRYHFYAGQRSIGLTHTFTWLGDPFKLKIKDLAISFGLRTTATTALVDSSAAFGQKPISVPVAAGKPVSLLQDELFHWGAGKDHFGIYRGTRAVKEGRRAGGWLSVQGDTTGLTLACRDFWQTYPKELRAEPNRVTALLWSTSGAAPPMDLSYDGLEKIWGPVVTAELKGPLKRPYENARQQTEITNAPGGLARSHELLLVFGQGHEAVAAAEAFKAQPLVNPDPQWIYASDVFGPMWPRDVKQFPKQEEAIEAVWDAAFKAIDDWGDYGFLYYGAGPHFLYTFDPRTGRAVASVTRYNIGLPMEAIGVMAWRGYIRSGDRRYFRYAAAHTQYVNDIVFCHENSSARLKGNVVWNLAPGPIPWAGNVLPAERNLLAGGSLGFFIEHAADHYYLTGDRRTLEVIREHAEAYKRTLDGKGPGWTRFMEVIQQNPDSAIRAVFQKFDECTTLYSLLGDEWFLRLADRLAGLLLDLNDPTGLKPQVSGFDPDQALAPYPAYIFYKRRALANYLTALEGADLDRVREVLVRIAEYQYRVQAPEIRGIGVHAAYVHRFTGSGDFLAYAVRLLERSQEPWAGGPMGQYQYRAQPRYGSAAWTIWGWPYLMGAMRTLKAPIEDPLLMFKAPGAPAADFVFRKEPGKPLTVELTVRRGTFTGPDGKPLSKQWLGRPTPYWGYHADDSDPPQDFYRLAIPAEAPVGDYRVHVGQEREGFVFTTSAAGHVLAAPQGFCPGQGDKGPWFFRAPAGQIDLVCSNPVNLTIKDANGQVLKMENSSDGGQFFIVPAGAADRPLSIQATGYATVKMKGIQPAYAYKSEAALFQPEGLKAVETLASAGVGAAKEQYLPGREGQGLLVNGKDSFAIPVSDQGKPGAVPLDPTQGTIEFYLRPNWDPAFVPLPMNAGLLSVDAEKGGIQTIYQRTAVNNQIHSGVAMLAWGPPRDGSPRLLRFEAASHVPMRPNRWVHVAYCWHMESGRFIQRLYVDGNFDNSSVMRYFSGGPEAVQHPQGYRQIRIGCGQAVTLNAVIDNVRISRVDRFPKLIWPKPYPVPDKLDADKDTIALFRFEGDTAGEGPDGRRYRAEFVDRPVEFRPPVPVPIKRRSQ